MKSYRGGELYFQVWAPLVVIGS